MKSVIIFTAFVLFSATAFSATIYVPDNYATIQGAIDASSNGDVVIVRPGTYVENIDFVGKAITVRSELGANGTIIDGSQAGPVVSFLNGESADTVLTGFSIKNGLSWIGGGGVRCYTASPTITDNIITENAVDGASGHGAGMLCKNNSSPIITGNVISDNHNISSHGGGIFCMDYSSPLIMNNVIENNHTDSSASWGGGIDCWEHSSPLITGNVIKNNSAHSGGGVSCSWYSDPIIEGNTIVFNTARDTDGGGVNCEGYSQPMIIGNFISHNSAPGTWGRGGGIHGPTLSTPVILNNIITNNTAGEWGGGIYSSNFSGLIAGNIISGNGALAGGGIYFWNSDASVINNTVYSNSADEGGGFRFASSSPTVVNTILWGNSAPTDPELSIDWASSPVLTYCDIEGGFSGNGNINADPIFVDAVNGDLHLSWNSPCLHTGDNSVVTELTDHEGDPRIALGTVDIGADEYYFHLYRIGRVVPGSPIDIKVVGYPTAPVLLALGSGIQDPPLSTQHGNLWLRWPPLWQGNIGVVPGDGILVLPTTVPNSWSTGEEHYLQSLIGPWNGPYSRLSNLLTLTVE